MFVCVPGLPGVPPSSSRAAWALHTLAFLPSSVTPALSFGDRASFKVAPLETHDNPAFLTPERCSRVLWLTAQAG